MATIHVDVVSAEDQIFSGEATFVALPGESGELGILPGHTPLITRIKPGEVRITRADDGRQESIVVAGGILEVQPHVVTVLADAAIHSDNVDEAKIKQARNEAQVAMQNAQGSVELAKAQAELALLTAQHAVFQRKKKK